jgi:nitrite reductase/ring-hydroxylating ferredoxin subunit
VALSNKREEFIESRHHSTRLRRTEYMGTKKTTRRERELESSRSKAKRNRLVIISTVIVAIIGVSIYFLMFGGSGGSNQSNEPIKATWIEPQMAGDTASIPVSEVEKDRNVHFNLKTQGEDMNFMVYALDGETFVRANVCPPCRSIGFSLEQAILICDTCATTFNAQTGAGIGGACVDYPKASVSYEIEDGNIVMNIANLVSAYQDTIEPGWA